MLVSWHYVNATHLVEADGCPPRVGVCSGVSAFSRAGFPRHRLDCILHHRAFKNRYLFSDLWLDHEGSKPHCVLVHFRLYVILRPDLKTLYLHSPTLCSSNANLMTIPRTTCCTYGVEELSLLPPQPPGTPSPKNMGPMTSPPSRRDSEDTWFALHLT